MISMAPHALRSEKVEGVEEVKRHTDDNYVPITVDKIKTKLDVIILANDVNRKHVTFNDIIGGAYEACQ